MFLRFNIAFPGSVTTTIDYNRSNTTWMDMSISYTTIAENRTFFRIGDIRLLLHTAAPPRLGVVLGYREGFLDSTCGCLLVYWINTVTSATTDCSWIVG